MPVESLGSVRKLLFIRKVCILLEYSSEFMIFLVLALSACVIIAFYFANFWFNCFITYSFLFVWSFFLAGSI